MQKIIDTHFHVFDSNKFTVLWVKEVPKLNKPILLEDYINAASSNEKYTVIGAIHIEIDSILEHKDKENEYFINEANNIDTIIKGVCIWADMLSEDFEQYVKQYSKEKCVKSVRYILHVPSVAKGTCIKDIFIKNAKLLGEMGLMFEGCLRAEDLEDFYKLAKTCSNTTFVLNHMGLPNVKAWNIKNDKEYVKQWEENIEKLGQLPNVYCKISGLSSANVNTIHPLVEHCFNSFGIDKIMFASNYPVCTLDVTFDEWASALIEICKEKPKEFTDSFFYKNAIKVYGLN